MAQLTQEEGFARLGGLSHMRLLVRMQERFVPAEQGIKQTSRGSVEGPGEGVGGSEIRHYQREDLMSKVSVLSPGARKPCPQN